MAKLTEDTILLTEIRKSLTHLDNELLINSTNYLIKHFIEIYNFLIWHGLDDVIAFARNPENNLKADERGRLTILYRDTSTEKIPTHNFWIGIQTSQNGEYQPISFAYLDFVKDELTGLPISDVVYISGNIATDRTPGSIKAEVLEIV